MKASRQKTDANSLRARAEELLCAKPSDMPTMPTADVQALVHELNVHQMELEIQNEELRQAQLELSHSRDRYSDLYDFAPVGYMTLDQDGRILEANLAAATLLGGERKRLVNANISTWLDHDAQDDCYMHRQAVFSSDARQNCEVNLHKADGTPMVVRLESIAFGVGHERQCRTALIDVTTVKHARQRLQESEQRYRRLTEAVTDYIYSVRVEHGLAVETIHGANCEAVTGYTPDEFSANPTLWIAMVPEENRELVEQQAAWILSGQDAPPIEHRIRRKDGQICWVLNTVSPQRDEQGHLIAYDGLLRDITNRKRADQALRMRDRALAATSNGVVITDSRQADNPVIYCNAGYERLTGYSFDEMVGHNCRFLQNDDHDQEGLVEIRAAVEEGRVGKAVIRNYRKDGSLFWNELTVSPVHDENGRVIHFVGIQNDVTARKQAEEGLKTLNETLEQRVTKRTEALRESERRYRFFVEQTHDGFYRLDFDPPISVNQPEDELMRQMYERGFIVESNDTFAHMYGYESAAAMTGARLEDLHGSADVPENIEAMREFVRAGFRHVDVETTELGKDGQVIYLANNSVGIIENDLYVSCWGTQSDITERKQAEEALRSVYEFSENLIDTAQCIVLVLDPKGRIVRFNSAFEHLSGWSISEAEGCDWFEMFVPDRDRQHIRQLFATAIDEEQTHENVTSILTKSGEEREIEWNDARLMDSDGNLVGLLYTGNDVTDRLRLEQEVINAAEEERRRIAQDLHDDLGSLLTGISLRVNALTTSLSKLGDGKQAEHARGIDELVQDAIRKSRTISQGLHPVGPHPEDLMGALRKLVDSVKAASTLRCQFRCPDPVLIDDPIRANHLFRIAQEAVNNAVKYSSGSQITVSLREIGDEITLSVTDNGSGFDRQEAGSGGLGLPTMNHRAAAVGGTLVIGRRKRGGTEVVCKAPWSAIKRSSAHAATR